jgi:hypothetical protein
MLQVIKHGHKGFYNTINNSLYFQLDLGFLLKKKRKIYVIFLDFHMILIMIWYLKDLLKYTIKK